MQIGQFTSTSMATSLAPRVDQIKQADAEAAKVEKLGKEFESVFASLMWKQMRNSMTESGLFESDPSDTLGGMFDLYMGQHMAEHSSLGFKDMVKADLSQKGLAVYRENSTLE